MSDAHESRPQIVFEDVQVWTPPENWAENPVTHEQPPQPVEPPEFNFPPMRPVEPVAPRVERAPRRKLGCIGRTLLAGAVLGTSLLVAGYAGFRATEQEIAPALDGCALDETPDAPATLQEAREAIAAETFIVESEQLQIAEAALAEATTDDEVNRAVNVALSGNGIGIFYYSNKTPRYKRDGMELPNFVTGMQYETMPLDQLKLDASAFLQEMTRLPKAWIDAARTEISVYNLYGYSDYINGHGSTWFNYDDDNHATIVVNPAQGEGLHSFLIGHLAKQCDIDTEGPLTLEVDGEPYEARLRGLTPSYDSLAEYRELEHAGLTLKEQANLADATVDCHGTEDSVAFIDAEVAGQTIKIRRTAGSLSAAEFEYAYTVGADQEDTDVINDEIADLITRELGVSPLDDPNPIRHSYDADFTDEDLECKRIYIPV